MLITDLALAQLCDDLYQDRSSNFDVIDPGLDDRICWAMHRTEDEDVIVLRGSVTPSDWILDSMASPCPDRRFGYVHHGFLIGLDHAWEDMRIVLRPDRPTVITGHSLGAARASILTGIMLADNRAPSRRVVFGEPKPGFANLAQYIKDVPARSYRTGRNEAHDLVTDIPFTMPHVGLNYVHPVPLSLLNVTPDPTDQSGIFVYHHIGLYVTGLKGEHA